MADTPKPNRDPHAAADAHGNAGWGDIRRTGQLGQFALLCMGIWLHAADTLLVATTMPAAVAEIGGDHLVSWTLSLYLLGSILASAGAALTAGRFGLHRSFIVAALVYAVGCAVSALAPDMITMLAGRLAQGVGGGFLVALTYVAIQRLFPKSMWPRLIALVAAIWGVSAFCGPLIGGFFADLGLWRWGFWAFAAQALALAVLVPAVMRPVATTRIAGRFPAVRLGLLSLAVLCVATAGIHVQAATSLPLVAVGVLCFVLFLRRDDRRAAQRMFPGGAFDMRGVVGAGFIANLTLSTVTMPLIIYGPFLLHHLHGTSALGAGYVIAAESVAWSVMAVLFSGVGAVGERRAMKAGALLILLGVAGMGPAMAFGPLAAVLALAVAQGAGFGLLWGYLIRRVVAATPDVERDSAASAMQTTQQIAFALAAALAGVIANLWGFAAEADAATLQRVGLVLFALFVPIAALGVVATWRAADDGLSRRGPGTGSRAAASGRADPAAAAVRRRSPHR